MKELEDASFSGKRVILRLSLDVPMDEDGNILDDQRLRVSLPTIHFLKNRFARIVIVGHLGRPDSHKKSLSLRPVYLRLSALLNEPIRFAPSIFSDKTKDAVDGLEDGQIMGLENLRFEKGELDNSRTFAKKLAKYGDIYVNDAFSVAHRESASTVAITEFLPSYVGMNFEQEVSVLGSLLKHPARPFIAVIGGVKVSDKLPTIANIAKYADKVLVGGAVANTFLAAQGLDVKSSVIDSDYIEKAKAIMKRHPGKIILPTDFLWGEEKILDQGRDTVKLFKTHLKSAKTIIWNGSLGHSEDPRYRHGSDEIAKFIADLPATTIIAGGNTTEIFSRLDLVDRVSFCSSGGGATLVMLSGGRLPALSALC